MNATDLSSPSARHTGAKLRQTTLAMLVSVPALLIALSAFPQGTVNFGNTTSTLVSTNAVAAGGMNGPTSSALGGFMYGLFTASSTVTSAHSFDLLTPTWTFTGVYATNSAISTGGRFSGGLNVATLTGWLPGQTNSFLVAGWSTDLGTSWSAVAAQLNVGYPAQPWPWGTWFGISDVGFGAAGGGALGLPAFSLISTAGPNGQGTPISSGWSLYTFVPEPSPVALLALAALLHQRLKPK